MITLKLAIRNLLGAGIRTWLNVAVLAISSIFIVWMQGLMEGWNQQARHDTIEWQIGGGQIWHEEYDRYDPLQLIDSHAVPPENLQDGLKNGDMLAVLMSQASIYPDGRMRSAILRGIDPYQDILALPTQMLLVENNSELPVLIGTSMARNTGLRQGDTFPIRWQDANNTFDATDAIVAGIFDCNVPEVDAGQVWLPLDRLREMLQMPGEATLLVARPGIKPRENQGWLIKDIDYLLSDIDQMIKMKSAGTYVFYLILLALGLLAIFDTQVLSIFRRQREIGTQMALGMTRWQVVRLFTVEGSMFALLALIAAAVVGGPLLWWQARVGFAMPEGYEDYGITIAPKIFPVYTMALLVGTALVVVITTTIVSFLPARKIARMRPTDAIRGRVQ
jgi:putative ABC transport system permease protein